MPRTLPALAAVILVAIAAPPFDRAVAYESTHAAVASFQPPAAAAPLIQVDGGAIHDFSTLDTGQSTDAAKQTVYVTRTGKKFHRDGCRYLARSRIPMALAEAAAIYGPCSVCRPPILKADPTTASATPAPSKKSVLPGRCHATTRRGTQCSRRAKAGSKFCWQHGG